MVNEKTLDTWNAIPHKGVQVITHRMVAVLMCYNRQSLGNLLVGEAAHAVAFKIAGEVGITGVVPWSHLLLPRHIAYINDCGEVIVTDLPFEKGIVCQDSNDVVDGSSHLDCALAALLPFEVEFPPLLGRCALPLI